MVQNIILFQIGWFSCVIGGASRDYNWIGVVVVAVIVAIHLARAGNARNEILLILITMMLGTAWDSGLMIAGLFTFLNGIVIQGIVPLWIIAMWALFATTLNVSMKWMKRKYLIAGAFGAIGGPVAYYAGHRLGAVDFNDISATLLAVSVGWAAIMPLLMMLTERFNGYPNVQNKTCEAESI